MTLTPAEIERKVRQLDKDMQSVYEMLAAIQGTQTRHTNRLDELGAQVGELSGQVGQLGGQVGQLQVQVTEFDQKMDTVLELLRAR